MIKTGRAVRACVLLATLGCSDAIAPPLVDGSYGLLQINGAALPYDHAGLGCCTYLGGQLELAEGHYAIAITARNRNTEVEFDAGEEGTYAQDRATLTFTRERYTIQPLLLGQATVIGSTITLSFGGEGPGAPDQFDAVFERVP